MRDSTVLLFETLLSRFPYTPSEPAETEAVERMMTARMNSRQFPKEYRHTVFELTDSLDILSYFKAHHAFLLGLDLGLSLSRSLEPFQEEL